MSPQFAKAVDPIFLYALALLERLNRDEPASPEEERLRIRTLIDQAEATLGAGDDWGLAKYALVSWIDEMLVDTLWDGREWWSNNVLEIDLFSTRRCNEQFFVNAKEASAQTSRDALEVYYVCVILGFRGLYHDQATGPDVARSLQLPRSLNEWTRQTALSIRLGQGRPPLSEPTSEVPGAPPLRSRSTAVWPWLSAVLLGAATVVLGYYWH